MREAGEPRALSQLRFPRFRRGYTMLEMVISVGTSAIILGALVLSAISLRRGIHGTETYSAAYAEQHRVTDFIARDLRRSLAVSYSDEAGNRKSVGDTPVAVTIAERSALFLTLPGYYRNPDERDDTALDVESSQERLDYGTAEALAEPVEVEFRKIFFAGEGCVCLVRTEAGRDQVILRDAEDLTVQVVLSPGGQRAAIKTWYHSKQLGPAPLVSTSDQILLRNIPADYRP